MTDPVTMTKFTPVADCTVKSVGGWYVAALSRPKELKAGKHYTVIAWLDDGCLRVKVRLRKPSDFPKGDAVL